MSQRSLYLNEEEDKALKQAEQEHGMAVNGIVRTALRAFLGLPIPAWARAINKSPGN